MKITPEQARAAAQVLFPEDYAVDRVEAILKTLDWLKEVEEEEPLAESVDRPAEQTLVNTHRRVPGRARKEETKFVMKRLAAHMKASGMSINKLAADLGLNGASLRTWLLNQYAPRPENLEKIQLYLDNLPS